MNQNRIAGKIRKLRELRNFTQAYMASELGIKQNTYSHLESGRARITQERLESIAQVLNVPTDELANGDPFVLIMNNNHGNNGYVSIENQQQHTVSEEFVKDMYSQYAQLIKTQQDMMKRQLELMENLATGAKVPK